VYDWANKEIIELFLKKEMLMERLESMKKYFFMEIGDFFVHLMDAAED
jgi:gamma-tubulin complex component 2